MASQPRLTRLERRVRASMTNANETAERCALFHWMKQHNRSMRNRRRRFVRQRGGDQD